MIIPHNMVQYVMKIASLCAKVCSQTNLTSNLSSWVNHITNGRMYPHK